MDSEWQQTRSRNRRGRNKRNGTRKADPSSQHKSSATKEERMDSEWQQTRPRNRRGRSNGNGTRNAKPSSLHTSSSTTMKGSEAIQTPPFPSIPVEEAVPAVLLQSLRASEEMATILNEHGLLATLQHLHNIEMATGRPPPFHRTTQLLRTMEYCFPKRPGSLLIPQYKERSVETMVRHMATLKGLAGRPNVSMYGDSIFERMTNGTKKPRTRPVLCEQSEALFNFSVGGDGVEHLLCRTQIAHPTYFANTPTFVLLIGINNVMGSRRGNESQSSVSSPEAIAEAIAGIVQYILQNSCHPKPTVYLCKLLHVLGSEDLDAPSINERVDRVNALLDSVPRRFPACQLLHTSMNLLPQNYMSDGLHPSPEGYRHLLGQLPACVQEQSVLNNTKVARSGFNQKKKYGRQNIRK